MFQFLQVIDFFTFFGRIASDGFIVCLCTVLALRFQQIELRIKRISNKVSCGSWKYVLVTLYVVFYFKFIENNFKQHAERS